MKIIISPAKTMKEGTGAYSALPSFLARTDVLLEELKEKSAAQLQNIYGCSEKIAETNAKRFAKMKLDEIMEKYQDYRKNWKPQQS